MKRMVFGALEANLNAKTPGRTVELILGGFAPLR
jgi:hypothetical protein